MHLVATGNRTQDHLHNAQAVLVSIPVATKYFKLVIVKKKACEWERIHLMMKIDEKKERGRRKNIIFL